MKIIEEQKIFEFFYLLRVFFLTPIIQTLYFGVIMFFQKNI